MVILSNKNIKFRKVYYIKLFSFLFPNCVSIVLWSIWKKKRVVSKQKKYFSHLHHLTAQTQHNLGYVMITKGYFCGSRNNRLTITVIQLFNYSINTLASRCLYF